MNSNKTKIFSFFLIAFVFVGIHPYGTSLIFAQFEKGPKAVIRPTGYDFGNIVQDSIIARNFVITNGGSDVLKITKVSASCGCTAVMPAKNELMPGESTDIKVTFNSKGKSGKQNKIITIETNDPKNSAIKLSLTGNVFIKESSSNQIEKSKTENFKIN